MSNTGKLIFEGSKSNYMLFSLEIWDLDSPYCTNFEYKLVIMV